MKKLKSLLCIFIIVMLCFSLTGCNYIDEMREAQIHYDNEGNLVYNNKKYIILPQCEDFSPQRTYDKTLYITEPDLPVLLNGFLGDDAYLTLNNQFIFSTGDNTSYYARIDIYESIITRIESGNYFDKYCYNNSYYDVDTNEYVSKKIRISDEISDAIDYIITGEPLEEVDPSLLYKYQIMDIYAMSEDELFNTHFATIYKTEKCIYIADYNDNAYIVPNEYNEIFTELIDEKLSQKSQYKLYIY